MPAVRVVVQRCLRLRMYYLVWWGSTIAVFAKPAFERLRVCSGLSMRLSI